VNLNSYQISRMIDLSAVNADNKESYIRSLVETAKKYQCIAVIPLPSYIPFVKELLADEPHIAVGGAIGFPSGGTTTTSKVVEAHEQVQFGCSELDMVMNIGKFLSKNYREVLNDLCAVVNAAGEIPVKVILECHYLSDDEIRKACDLCIQAGAAYVKTGTGWAPTGATLQNISLIKSHVGDAIKIKAAGGVRDLQTVLSMYQLGATRFGIGLKSANEILYQVETLPHGIAEI
jgi:deoxyribose-phosphate aldolase